MAKKLSKIDIARAKLKKDKPETQARGTGVQPRTMRRVQEDNKKKKLGFWAKAAKSMQAAERDVTSGKRSGLVGITKALGGEYLEEEEELAKKTKQLKAKK